MSEVLKNTKEKQDKNKAKGRDVMKKAGKKLFFILVLMGSFLPQLTLQAKVWEATRSWTPALESEFEAWVGSGKVHESMFQSSSSPYKGASVDCADVAYGLRLIFAFEHQLPFGIKNPSYNPGNPSSSPLISNNMTSFDSLPAGGRRVVALINHIAGSSGTESLALNDSYPVKLSTIAPGSVYMYKTKNGSAFVRHTYVIKNVTAKGTMDVIYSTQSRKQKGLPMALMKEETLPHLPKWYRWGFRRLKTPDEILAQTVGDERGQSQEQFALADTIVALAMSGNSGLGQGSLDAKATREFMKRVQKQLASVSESPAQVLTRTLKALCDQATERVGVVRAAVERQAQVGGRCFDYTDYDTHSTPSRDGRLVATFDDLQATLAEVRGRSEVPRQLIALAASIFSGEGDFAPLLEYCPITYRPGKTISLATLFVNATSSVMSYHPNDNIDRRWGLSTGSKTSCHAFYGME